jgi:putative ABC transport system permease protein
MRRIRWLLATSLRGLASRTALSLGSLLLTAIAVASAVVGPSYQLNAANSFVIAQLEAQPLINTGLTYDYRPDGGESPDRAIATALGETARESGTAYRPGHAILWDQLDQTSLPHSSVPAVARLVSVPGACRHVGLVGRCPSSPGEIAVLKADAATYRWTLGSRVRQPEYPATFTVVGIYTPRAEDDAFWFGPRLQTAPGHVLPQLVPSRPAPWLTTQAGIELSGDAWFVTVDQALDVTPHLTPDDAAAAAARVRALRKDSERGSLATGLTLEAGNSLPETTHQLLVRRGVARSTVAPAVLSLILVALVLLSRLLAAAMGLRRGELALASLRGYSRRQLWFLGMLEPLLILALATPLGVALGYVATRVLARRWLVPGLPVPFVLASGLAVVVVVLVTGVVAALVVRDAVNEPLSAQIAGVRRPARAGRALVIVRLALVAAAVAALVVAASRSHPQAPDATDLALPMLLAVAVGVLCGLFVLLVSELWVRWSARRRALSSYVASRTVRRRREGTLVILPVTAALTVAVFTVGVSLAASTWRASAAATQVGAPLSFATDLSLSRAVGVTQELDPEGRWLMAAGINTANADESSVVLKPRVVVDTRRLARVASWPSGWTPGRSAAQVARALGPQRPSVVLTGSEVTVGIDNQVRGDFRQLGLSLALLDDDGVPREVSLGPYRQGSSTATARLPACERGCQLQTISFGGPAALVEAMQGTATIESFTVDGKPVPGALDAPWRAAASQVGTSTGVRAPPRLQDGHLRVSFEARSSSSYAGISPTDVPAVVPVLWGRTATQQTRLQTGSSGLFTVRSAGTAESMPFRGPSGMMIDFTMFTRNTTQDNSTNEVYIWARADTPGSVLDQLAARGLSHPVTEAAARDLLDQDAFALALRLYVVVTVLVILLAFAGLAANLAVQLPSRRRDAASLRVVGVRRRSIMVGVVAEFLLVLGAAALAGITAGAVAQYVVVRTVTLGFADTELTPRVLPSFHLTTGVVLGLVVMLVLLVLASVFAALTVRGARTSSLRENAR